MGRFIFKYYWIATLGLMSSFAMTKTSLRGAKRRSNPEKSITANLVHNDENVIARSGFADGRHEVSPGCEKIEPTVPNRYKGETFRAKSKSKTAKRRSNPENTGLLR